ncbi:MAG: polysaccharide biosynthesis tyrosine autokinase [Deltaproteobacteria bacterium]|nr:polysaccharide biosynthesis tyrosine autokinase [Deltaproteobacteria bacterium]
MSSAPPTSPPPADAGAAASSSQSSGESPSGASAAYHLAQRVWRVIWRFKWIVVVCAVATFAASYLYVSREQRVYQASATVEFDLSPQRPLGDEVGGGDAIDYWVSREYYETQLRILTSHRVAEGVVRTLALHRDAEFFSVPESERRTWRPPSVESAAATLRGRVKVDQVRDTRLASIVVDDTDPRRAARIANAYADVYARQNLEQRLGSTVSALEWLTEQLDTLKGQLERSELALHDFKRENDILSVSLEDQRNLTANSLQQLNQQLTALSGRRVEASARATELSRIAATDPDSLPGRAFLESPTLVSLREQYRAAVVERDVLRTKLGGNFPSVAQAERRVETTRNAVVREAQNIIGAARADLREIERAESGIRGMLERTKQQALELNLREIEYNRLAREKVNNEKLYGLLLERTSETDLARMLKVNNVRVVDRALVPTIPIRPRVSAYLAIGGLLGIALGLCAALLLSLADRTIKLQQDIESLGMVFLGILPRVTAASLERGVYASKGKKKKPEPAPTGPRSDLIVHTHPASAAAECIRAVRTNLLFMAADRPLRTVLVASANPREGKTTVAISIAIALGQTGNRVLLVDTDMRRPRVHRAFGMSNSRGLSNALIGDLELDELIQQSDVPGLDVLPCGPTPPNPAELLHAGRFAEVVRELTSRYDRVVFDSPPLAAVTDGAVLSSLLDTVVLVVRAGSTTHDVAAQAIRQLRDVRARVAGAVLNDVNLDDRAGYYYRHYYYRRAGYYSDEGRPDDTGRAANA